MANTNKNKNIKNISLALMFILPALMPVLAMDAVDNEDPNTQKAKDINIKNKGLFGALGKVSNALSSAYFVKSVEASFGRLAYERKILTDGLKSTGASSSGINFQNNEIYQNAIDASFDFGLRFDLSNSIKFDALGIIGTNGVGAGANVYAFAFDSIGIFAGLKSTYVLNYFGKPDVFDDGLTAQITEGGFSTFSSNIPRGSTIFGLRAGVALGSLNLLKLGYGYDIFALKSYKDTRSSGTATMGTNNNGSNIKKYNADGNVHSFFIQIEF